MTFIFGMTVGIVLGTVRDVRKSSPLGDGPDSSSGCGG